MCISLSIFERLRLQVQRHGVLSGELLEVGLQEHVPGLPLLLYVFFLFYIIFSFYHISFLFVVFHFLEHSCFDSHVLFSLIIKHVYFIFIVFMFSRPSDPPT